MRARDKLGIICIGGMKYQGKKTNIANAHIRERRIGNRIRVRITFRVSINNKYTLPRYVSFPIGDFRISPMC